MAPQFRYTIEKLKSALEAVQDGETVAGAAKRFGVPRTTLLDRLKSQTPLVRKMGPGPVLTRAEEDDLATWVLELAKRGSPVTKDQLLDSVAKLVATMKRENKFKDGRPGTKWYASFLRRHPELSLRVCQNLTKSRANITEKDLRDWFKEVEECIVEKNLQDVIKDPVRVFNLDETAFYFSPEGNKALAGKGSKAVYNTIATGEKENVSVLLNINAAGNIAPPLVIFSMQRMSKPIAESAPSSWCLGKSINGWMTGELFYEYMVNTFHPWLLKEEIPLPVIVFVDGHTSHNSYHFSNFAKANGIEMFFLLANSTHLTQPLDVGIFKPLKAEWKKVVHEYKVGTASNPSKEVGITGKRLKREDFCHELQKAIQRSVKPQKVQNAFRAAGIFPLNANNVKYCNLTNLTNPEPTSSEAGIKNRNYPTDSMLEFLEDYLGSEKREAFQNAEHGAWPGEIQNQGLFEFWKHLKKSIDGKTHSSPANLNSEFSEAMRDESMTMTDPQFNNCLVETDAFLPRSNGKDNSLLTRESLNNAEFIFTDTYAADEATLLRPDEEEKDSSSKANLKEFNVVDEITCDLEIERLFQNISNESLEMDVEVISPSQLIDFPETNTTLQKQPTSTIAEDLNVSSVFKDTLFWPAKVKDQENSKKKKRILPASATSEKWLEYLEEKEKEKSKKLQDISNRKVQRLKKKEALEALKKKKAEKKQKKKENTKIEKLGAPNADVETSNLC